MAIEADVSQLPLDEQLLAVLPGKLQEEWQKLRPEGLIDANIKLRYDGRAWQPQVRIQCQNVSFAHHKFPYRLEHGNGLLELKDDRLQMDLSTFSENQLVHIVGEIRNPTERPDGLAAGQRATSCPSTRSCSRPCRRRRSRWPVPWI